MKENLANVLMHSHIILAVFLSLRKYKLFSFRTFVFESVILDCDFKPVMGLCSLAEQVCVLESDLNGRERTEK